MGGCLICSWVLYFFNTCSQSCPAFKLIQMEAMGNQLTCFLWDLVQDDFKKKPELC